MSTERNVDNASNLQKKCACIIWNILSHLGIKWKEIFAISGKNFSRKICQQCKLNRVNIQMYNIHFIWLWEVGRMLGERNVKNQCKTLLTEVWFCLRACGIQLFGLQEIEAVKFFLGFLIDKLILWDKKRLTELNMAVRVRRVVIPMPTWNMNFTLSVKIFCSSYFFCLCIWKSIYI